MSNPTSSLTAETQAVRDAYAALNRGDVAGFVAAFDPQVERVERIEPADFPGGGATYRGLAAVTAHVAKGRGTWAEGGCEPQRFVVAGDHVIVSVHVHVRVNGETEWRDGRTTDIFTFRNGKAIGFRTFADEREAVDWARAHAPDAPVGH